MTLDNMSAAERIKERARTIIAALKTSEGMLGWMPFLFAALVENGELPQEDLDDAIGRANRRREDAPAYLTGVIKRRVEAGRISQGTARHLLSNFGVQWDDSFSNALTDSTRQNTTRRIRTPNEQIESRRMDIIRHGRKAGSTNRQINEILRSELLEEIPEYD